MEAIATQKYIRTSPRKLRVVARAVSKMSPTVAVETLALTNRRAADPLAKVVKTAIANAVDKGASPENLVFKEIQIQEGPTLKRGRPVSRGQWHAIKKRGSHIRVVVETKKEEVKETKIKKSKIRKDPPARKAAARQGK